MMQAYEFFQLTEEQRAIVELPVDARVLVTAGPGTGKTHTMTARIYHMVRELNVAPGAEILILTFTRAAVREIRRRCRGVGGDLSYVSAITFDSFASRLLRRLHPEALETPAAYDERIEAARRLIETNADTHALLSQFQHVFVDEIQDLVGVRSSFVKAILEHSGAGFSLFGDPAQSIYNYQLDGQSRDVGSMELYEWIVNRYPDVLQCRLTKNHRARSRLARWALKYGKSLTDDPVDYHEVYEQLVRDIDSYEPSIPLSELSTAIKSFAAPGKTAVLCRTNGECQRVSQCLWDEGISHTIRRRAEERHIPKWLALALRDFEGVEIRSVRLKERLRNAGVSDPDSVYDTLSRMAGGTRTGLRVPDLRDRLARGLIPDELEPVEEHNIVVSTIHRAKGLEFDTVLFLWSSPAIEQEYPGEEARVLYVALTRPVKNLVRVGFDGFPGLIYEDRSERWIERRHGWRLRRIEVNDSDVSTEGPPGSLAATPRERLEIQHYLGERVHPGDPVTLVNADPNGALPHLCFHIQHGDKIIGTTNPTFSRALDRLITNNWRPGRIRDVRVSGVRTVVGDPAQTKRIELGSHGLWLVPEISGLGNLGN